MITPRIVTAKDARDNFTDILGAVYYGREPVIVKKKGKTMAVVINPDDFIRYQKAARERFFEIVDEVQADNRNKRASEVLPDVTAAVEQVRKIRYGRGE